MTQLRRRSYELVVQTISIVGLDIDFQIVRSLDATANTAEIVIYNLSSDNRRALSSVTGGVVVSLKAGYMGSDPTNPGVVASDTAQPSDLPLLFLGTLREVTHLRNGADWETHVSSGDGDKDKRPIKFSLGANSTLKAAIERSIGELKSGIGNGLQAIAGAGFEGSLSKVFPDGVVADGNADDVLSELLESAGKEFSIQNGEAQVLDRGKVLNLPAILVSDTALIGSPEAGEKGTLKFRCFLNGDIVPGRQVRVESESVNGFYRAETVGHNAAFGENDWYTDIEAKPVA